MRGIHTFCIAAAIVVRIDDDVTFGERFARFVQQIRCGSFSLSQRFRIRCHVVLFRAGHVTVGTVVFDGDGFIVGVVAIVIVGLVCGIGTSQATGVLLLFGAHFIKVFENSNYRQLNSTNRHIRTGQQIACGCGWMGGRMSSESSSSVSRRQMRARLQLSTSTHKRNISHKHKRGERKEENSQQTLAHEHSAN